MYIFYKHAITSSIYSSAGCVICLLGRVRVAEEEEEDCGGGGEAEVDKVADEESLDDGAFLANINNGVLELAVDVSADILLLLMLLVTAAVIVVVLFRLPPLILVVLLLL